MCTCVKKDCGRNATFAVATVLDGRLASVKAFDGLCGRCHQIDHKAAVPGTFFFARVDAIYDLEEVQRGDRKVVSGRRNQRGDLCSIDGCVNRSGAYELHGQRGKYRICTECAIAAMVVTIDTGDQRMYPHLIAEARQEQGSELLSSHSDASIAHQAKPASVPAPVNGEGRLVVPIRTVVKQGQFKASSPKKPDRKQRAKPANAAPRKLRPAKAAQPARKAPRTPAPTVSANPVPAPPQTDSVPADGKIVFGGRYLVLVTKYGLDPVTFERAKTMAYAKALEHAKGPEGTGAQGGDILAEVRKLPGGPKAIGRMQAAERRNQRRPRQPEQPTA